jgi:hypothetical protein
MCIDAAGMNPVHTRSQNLAWGRYVVAAPADAPRFFRLVMDGQRTL